MSEATRRYKILERAAGMVVGYQQDVRASGGRPREKINFQEFTRDELEDVLAEILFVLARAPTADFEALFASAQDFYRQAGLAEEVESALREAGDDDLG